MKYLLIALVLTLVSCAPDLGTTIEAPPVPVQTNQGEVRARLGSVVNIEQV